MTQLQQDAQLFKAAGHPIRLLVLTLLREQDGTLDVVTLLDHLLKAGIDIQQSTLSYHLKTLMTGGIITYTYTGHYSYYTIRPDAYEKLRHVAEHYTRQENEVLA